MTEIETGMERMYETEIFERERIKEKKKGLGTTTMLFALLLVITSGLMMPAPANWYVWIVGSMSILLLRQMLW